jgi:hypothetical protein
MTGITPIIWNSTVTREQLLALRDAEERRLREKWAKGKESANDTSK